MRQTDRQTVSHTHIPKMKSQRSLVLLRQYEHKFRSKPSQVAAWWKNLVVGNHICLTNVTTHGLKSQTATWRHINHLTKQALYYNVSLRGFRVNMFAVENQNYILWACFCSLSYPACNTQAPYYIVICGLYGFNVFFHITHKRHDVRGKNGIAHKICVIIFSTNLSEKYLILRRNKRDIIKNVHRSSC
jgi:hypothetical protein